MQLEGTTIVGVLRNGKCAVAGDGQVTMGQSVIFKSGAVKVRRIYHGSVVTGFAGTVADAFALCDMFEQKLEQYSTEIKNIEVDFLSVTKDTMYDENIGKILFPTVR